MFHSVPVDDLWNSFPQKYWWIGIDLLGIPHMKSLHQGCASFNYHKLLVIWNLPPHYHENFIWIFHGVYSLVRLCKPGPCGRVREWARLGIDPLSWLRKWLGEVRINLTKCTFSKEGGAYNNWNSHILGIGISLGVHPISLGYLATSD